jgi:two-component system, NarL family, nitrate/nitrite response regulator NarL
MGPTTVSPHIRVCLVDDHQILCQGLATMLEREPDIKVVAQCYTVAEGLAAASSGVDVLVLDLRLGGEDGFTLLEQLRAIHFPGRVIILAAEVKGGEVRRLIGQGVSGILLKNSPWDRLIQCIRSVASGQRWLEQAHLDALFSSLSEEGSSEDNEFTDREKTVLRALLEGLSNKEIAAQLDLRETSVKFILQTLFRKTGVHTRGQLVRVALERQLQ